MPGPLSGILMSSAPRDSWRQGFPANALGWSIFYRDVPPGQSALLPLLKGPCNTALFVGLAPCCPAATCHDAVQNGDETGVDCGGSCGPCEAAWQWRTVVELSAAGDAVTLDVGADAFNEAFRWCPVVRYRRNGGTYAIYTRLSPLVVPFNAYQLFTYLWSSTANVLGTDFALYGSEVDAWWDMNGCERGQGPSVRHRALWKSRGQVLVVGIGP